MKDAAAVVRLRMVRRVLEGLGVIRKSCLRLATFEGEYRWHFHPDSDELFVVIDGQLEIDLAGGSSLRLRSWDMVTIPAGVVHRTRACGRTINLTFEHLDAGGIIDDKQSVAMNGDGAWSEK